MERSAGAHCKKSDSIQRRQVGRFSGAYIALAAVNATAQGDDPLLLVLAADHVIQNQANFIQAVQQAIPQAAAGKLVTFGIVPHAPGNRLWLYPSG